MYFQLLSHNGTCEFVPFLSSEEIRIYNGDIENMYSCNFFHSNNIYNNDQFSVVINNQIDQIIFKYDKYKNIYDIEHKLGKIGLNLNDLDIEKFNIVITTFNKEHKDMLFLIKK